MPAVIKHLLIFKDDSGYGWTEVHYRQSDSDTPNLQSQMDLLTGTIAPLRSAILGLDQQVVGARVSYPRAGVIASLPKDLFLPGAAGKFSAAEALSLACRFVDSTRTRGKTVHLRGFWDDAEIDGDYHPEHQGAEGFADRIDAWKRALIQATYGWLSRDATTSSKGDVTNYTVSAGNHITFTLGNDPLPAGVVGKVIPIRFSRLNNGRSTLNTTLLVRVTSPTEVVTVQQVASGTFLAAGRYNFRATSFVGYSLMPTIKVGRRAAGKVIGRLPGRARAKARI